MSTDILKGMTNLEKQMEEIGNMVKGSVANSHLNPETNSLSFFEEDDSEPIQMVKGRLNTMRKGRRFRAPKGYQRQFKSFSEFLRLGYKNKSEFESRHHKAVDMLVKANAMNTLDSESAGALVLPEFAPDIAAIYYDNDVLSRTNQFTVSGNTMAFPKLQEESRADGSRTGGLLGYWLEEGDLASAGRPSIDATELKLKKLCVVVYLTDELLEDNSYALEQWVRQAVQREIAFMTGDACFNGPGGKRMLGFLNSTACVQVAKENAQTADTINSQNILNMWSRRRTGQPVDAYAWYINQEIEPQLYSMTLGSGGQNGVVYLPPGGLSASPYATLMGRPVIPTEFNQKLGDKGDIVLANLGQYVTISKGGVQELVSPHVEFLRGQTAIKFTFRIDGRPLFDKPTTPKYGTVTQGDFIALEAR